MRTIVDIPEEQISSLDQIATRRNISRAAVIRDAIEHYLDRSYKKSLDEAFGLWAGRPDHKGKAL